MVKLEIDGFEVEVPEGTSILEAARKANISIPTLCYHEDLAPSGACGICSVEVEGRGIVRSCSTPVEEGMKVKTFTPRLQRYRKTVLQLVLAYHPMDCPTCIKNGHCELQDISEQLGVRESKYIQSWAPRQGRKDTSSVAIVYDPGKCIGCGRCVYICNEVQTVHALQFHYRGWRIEVGAGLGRGLGESVCVNCGQCTVYCPVAGIYEKENIEELWDAIEDPDKHTVVQEAPAVRVSLGEEFGMPVGTPTPGKMYTAMRKLGFDTVFDTAFAADLTIVEEANEVVERIVKGENLPAITSCCPAWIKFMETYYPDLMENVSSAKSPQQMFGALAKTYFAESKNIPKEKIVSVSVMPCTAKKFEAAREEMKASGLRDVDIVITTRELIRMLKEAGIDFPSLPESQGDWPMGVFTGAGAIFAATGGVMEAALRTAYEIITGKELKKLDFEEVRGMKGVKEATIHINGKELKVAVAHGLGNARKILEKVRKDKARGVVEYHFIEIMACPGGCVGGGGQRYGSSMRIRKERADGIYELDSRMSLRKSHENPGLQEVYRSYLKKPLSDIAERLLHTSFYVRDII